MIVYYIICIIIFYFLVVVDNNTFLPPPLLWGLLQVGRLHQRIVRGRRTPSNYPVDDWRGYADISTAWFIGAIVLILGLGPLGVIRGGTKSLQGLLQA